MPLYPFNAWCPLKGHAYLKGPHSGLRQFLTTKGLLKVMKNAFYFILKALFVLETFSSLLLGYVATS